MIPINILLVDDHILFAKSLSIALEDYNEIEQLYATQDVDSLDKLITEKNINIVLMDISLGKISDADGLELASKLLNSNPTVKIIFLTGYDLPVYRHEAKKIGVSGFLNKNINPETLIESLLHVYHGGNCFPTEDHEVVIEDLTSMEKKILLLLYSGEKRKNIAGQLYISERTLSNHLQHIFDKLGVSSSVEAISKAIQLGYISPVF